MSRVSIVIPEFSRRYSDYLDFDGSQTKRAFVQYYGPLIFTKIMSSDGMDIYRANLQSFTTGIRYVALMTTQDDYVPMWTTAPLAKLSDLNWIYFQTADDFTGKSELPKQPFEPPYETLLETEMKYYDDDDHGTKYTCEELNLEIYLLTAHAERWAIAGTVKKALEEYATMIRFV